MRIISHTIQHYLPTLIEQVARTPRYDNYGIDHIQQFTVIAPLFSKALEFLSAGHSRRNAVLSALGKRTDDIGIGAANALLGDDSPIRTETNSDDLIVFSSRGDVPTLAVTSLGDRVKAIIIGPDDLGGTSHLHGYVDKDEIPTIRVTDQQLASLGTVGGKIIVDARDPHSPILDLLPSEQALVKAKFLQEESTAERKRRFLDFEGLKSALGCNDGKLQLAWTIEEQERNIWHSLKSVRADIGLVKTELTLNDRLLTGPAEARIALYKDVIAARAHNRNLTFRVFDYSDPAKCSEVLLASERWPTITNQIYELLRAGEEARQSIRIMFPMVDTTAEAESYLRSFYSATLKFSNRTVPDVEIGFQIESPTGVNNLPELMRQFRSEVSFIAIGASDLSWRTMPTFERNEQRNRANADYYHPQFIRALKQIADSVREENNERK